MMVRIHPWQPILFPSRLSVGLLTLDQSSEVRILGGEPILSIEDIMKIHQVINVKVDGKYTGLFVCKICPFAGPLTEAISHSISNQFKVESKPIRPKTSWLKANKVTYENLREYD